MKPWISGPNELLIHASKHIEGSEPFDQRIAFISIDNAIELMIKTYLGLPKRIRKSEGPKRIELQQASYGFPDLLDLLEKYASDKLEGIELGDIEWYHRLRNTLYHEGNGVTVDPANVDGYLQVSRILFRNLFEKESHTDIKLEPTSVIGDIVLGSSELEHKINLLYKRHFPDDSSKFVPIRIAIGRLEDKGALPKGLTDRLREATAIRNEAVHNAGQIDTKKIKKGAEIIWEIAKTIASLL